MLVTALAAIGGILVGGVQLSSLGQLALTNPLLYAAGLAYAATLLLVGRIIWKVSEVLVTQRVSLPELKKAEEKAKQSGGQKSDVLRLVEDNPQLLKEFGTVGELYDEYREVEGARAAALRKGEADEVQIKETRLSYLNGIVSELLYSVLYERVRQRYDEAVRCLRNTGIFVAILVAIFAWAANPPRSSRPRHRTWRSRLWEWRSGRSCQAALALQDQTGLASFTNFPTEPIML